MVTSIIKGYVNDDFLHDRVTGVVKHDDGNINAFKFYSDGSIVDFDDQRFSGGEYEEKELHIETIKEIQKYYEGTTQRHLEPMAGQSIPSK